MQLPLAIYSESIALVYDNEGTIIDEISNWETVETYAMHDDEVSVVAIAGDPFSSFYDTAEALQAMIDRCVANRIDCFGA